MFADFHKLAKDAGSKLHKVSGLLVTGLALMVLAGCAKQSIVLVPDPQGHVGQAEVTTWTGKQVLEKSGDMTRVGGTLSPPSSVTTADPAYISSTFGEALAVEPAPRTFTLLFKTGTTILQPGSLKMIPVIASTVKRLPATRVSIAGYTDTTASYALNDRLSLRRAKRVKALLVQKGVKSGLISVSFYGERKLAVPTRDNVPKLLNRRVVVIIR